MLLQACRKSECYSTRPTDFKLTPDMGKQNLSLARLPHLLSRVSLLLLLLPLISIAEQSVVTTQSNPAKVDEYGVDVSWPMQHVVDNQRYKIFMDGCYQQGLSNFEKRADGLYQRKDGKHGGGNDIDEEFLIACDNAEQDRLEMNRNQPKEIQNYTHSGYAKVPTPSKVIELLRNFWEKNERYTWPEFWDDGNTYVNHWEIPTRLLNIGRQDLPYTFTTQEYDTIIQSIQEILESWTNQPLILTSAYGIRVYGEGAILAPHVDRLPLVSSAIINVFQYNVTEPWVLELIGHDGIAHNLTADPSEMILYESASIIHGRPFPLKGKGAMYGSIFVHFEPLYHTSLYTGNAGNHYSSKTVKERKRDSKNAFEEALKEQLQKPILGELKSRAEGDKADEDVKPDSGDTGYSNTGTSLFRKTPGYVWPDYVSLYDQRFYFEYNDYVYPKTVKSVLEKLNSHQAASSGELNVLKDIAMTQGRMQLFKEDRNGWKPLHEAARSGHADVVEYLLNEGAKVNERTNFDKGGNALYWAQKNPKENAKAIAVLEKYGGVVLTPKPKKITRSTITEDTKDPEKTTVENEK